MRACDDLPRASRAAIARPWTCLIAATLAAAACGADEDVGGAGDSQTTKPPPDPSTTDVTPTTTATDSDATVAPTSTGDDTTSTGDDTTSTTAPPDPLTVDCEAPPSSAVGANYSHQPSAAGGTPDYTWSAKGLPDGLTIDPNTGEITGAPTAAGDFAFELTVTDEAGQMASADCPALVVNDKLSVDLDAISGPCILEGETILDFVTGGDGSPITCVAPKGTGDGKVPQGITIDKDTCEIVGSIAETRYGTWAWIVRASQSGVDVYAPYCATQDQQAPKAYTIVGDHSGGKDNELEPLELGFKPESPLLLDGDADPYFEVTRDACGGSCFFGFAYTVSSSPFGLGACNDDKDKCFGLCPLVPDANEPDGDKQIGCSLVPKNMNPKIGFAHEMWAKGDAPPSDFADRPFVMQWGIDYCISTVQADCTGKQAILDNGDNSNLEFAVILRPQG